MAWNSSIWTVGVASKAVEPRLLFFWRLLHLFENKVCWKYLIWGALMWKSLIFQFYSDTYVQFGINFLKAEEHGHSGFYHMFYKLQKVYVLYARHHNPLLIINRSWILTVWKARIFLEKSPLKNVFYLLQKVGLKYTNRGL